MDRILNEFEKMDPQAWAELQLERLKQQLNYVYEHSPFYKRKFDKAFWRMRISHLAQHSCSPVGLLITGRHQAPICQALLLRSSVPQQLFRTSLAG